MKPRLILYFKYLFFWLIFFWVSKLVFLVFNFHDAVQLGFSTWIKIFIHGFRLDLSAVGYLLFLPGLIIISTAFSKSKWLFYLYNIYTIIFLFINILFLIGDVELYNHWKYRLDATPLLYLNKPSEVLGSVSFWILLKQILIGISLFAFFIWFYYKWVALKIKSFQPTDWKIIPAFLFILALCFVQIRGGLGLVPMNISIAYFHQNTFVNHATVNLFWNIGSSLLESDDLKNRFEFFDKNVAETEFKKLYTEPKKTTSVLKSDKSNVLIIILESFTAKALKVLGGRDSITPNFNKLYKEGILFNNFYASGDRSDKGIVAVLSGYPALPKTSIMKYPSKNQQLPSIANILKKNGYSTAFYYGGDPDFANIKAYILGSGFKDIISKNNFSSDVCNAKWGVHDHIMFDRLIKDLNAETKPFFYTFFTLSSHEPYDVPANKNNSDASEEVKFLNSIHYTDSCIGIFIEKAKLTKWWHNTLIVFVADHGHLMPNNTGHWDYLSFKIPMLWLGGALSKTDTIISHTASQTDIPATILSQLHNNFSEFKFSQNAISLSNTNFAFYAFNDGFGFISDQNILIYDNNLHNYIKILGNDTAALKPLSKSFLQVLYTDFINK